MKLHILTIGKPKLQYAKLGWEEYLGRLRRYHTVRVTHLADKWANDADKILEATSGSFRVGLMIKGQMLSSEELAVFLQERALVAREVSFMIGGPDGLPDKVQAAIDFSWSLSKRTLPHDLAMVNVAEALYRASTINAGTPYHH